MNRASGRPRRPQSCAPLLPLLEAEAARARRAGPGLALLCLKGPRDSLALLGAEAQDCDALRPLEDGAALLLPGLEAAPALELARRVLAACPERPRASALLVTLSPERLEEGTEALAEELERALSELIPSPEPLLLSLDGPQGPDPGRVTAEERSFLLSAF